MNNFIKRFLFGIHKKLEQDLTTLRYLFFEITTRCNLTCLHCGSDCSSESIPNQLTKEEWLEFIDYLAAHFYPPSITVVITGGEPLMLTELDCIGRKLSSKGFRWGIVTNGYLLNEKRFNSLYKAGMRYGTVSLDGPESTHNHLRNTSQPYSKVLDAIRLMNVNNLFCDVVTCVYPGNMTYLDDTAEILLSLGVKHWRLFSIISKGRASENTSLHMSNDQWKELIRLISENKPVYEKRGLSLNFSCEGYFPSGIDSKIRDLPFMCRAGVNIAGILSDGTIASCPNISRRFAQGSIRTDDFADIWTKGYKQFRNRSLILNDQCVACNSVKQCQGSSMHLYNDDGKLMVCHKSLTYQKD